MNAENVWERACKSICGATLNQVSGQVIGQLQSAADAARHDVVVLTLGGLGSSTNADQDPNVIAMHADAGDRSAVAVGSDTFAFGVEAVGASLPVVMRWSAAMQVMRPYRRPAEPKAKRPRTGWGRSNCTNRGL